MTKDEIVTEVIRLLRHNKQRLLGGSIHQDPYKHDFFALFAEAYNAGLMKGSQDVLYADALKDLIVARAPELADEKGWRNLSEFWLEWTYAWDHASELRR
jgi:hypothetical protein